MSQFQDGPAPGQSFSSAEAPEPAAQNVPLALAWAAVVATAGGFACGWPIIWLGTMGGVSITGLGVLAGYVARRIIVQPSRLVGWCLVASCIVALIGAELTWLRFASEAGLAGGWWTALELLPVFFFQERILAAVFGTIFTLIGAYYAYEQTAIETP